MRPFNDVPEALRNHEITVFEVPAFLHAGRIELDGESYRVIDYPLDLATLVVAVDDVITGVEVASKVMFDLAGVPGQALLSDVFRHIEVLIVGSRELLREVEWLSEVVKLAP